MIPLRTNDGRVVANFDIFTGAIIKRVKEETSMLRKPPAWTWDISIVEQVEEAAANNKNCIQRWWWKFIVETTDTKKVYTIDWESFHKHAYEMGWRQDPKHRQYVVLLKYWTERGEGLKQLSLFS